MRKSLVMVSLVVIFAQAAAQYPGYHLLTEAGAFRESFAAASQRMQTIVSDFVQEKKLSLLSEKIVSKGRFWFKRDNLVRMEYQQPFQYLLILNNGNVYVRDGQKENRMSAKSNKLFQQINGIIVDCLKGTVLNNPDFKSRIFENAGGYLLELTPLSKNLGALFKNIVTIVDKKDFLAASIDMYELSGDQTSIHFVNRELNSHFPDALFTIH